MSTLAIHDMFRLYLLILYTTIKYYIFPLKYRTAACAINAWAVVTYFPSCMDSLPRYTTLKEDAHQDVFEAEAC